MTEVEIKVLADLYNIKVDSKLINFAIQCFGKGFQAGREHQAQVDEMNNDE